MENKPIKNCRVFVGGISWKADEKSLTDFFTSFGKVSSCKIIMDKITGKSKGYGFITFENEESANLVKQAQKIFFLGKTMNVGDAMRKNDNINFHFDEYGNFAPVYYANPNLSELPPNMVVGYQNYGHPYPTYVNKNPYGHPYVYPNYGYVDQSYVQPVYLVDRNTVDKSWTQMQKPKKVNSENTVPLENFPKKEKDKNQNYSKRENEKKRKRRGKERKRARKRARKESERRRKKRKTG